MARPKPETKHERALRLRRERGARIREERRIAEAASSAAEGDVDLEGLAKSIHGSGADTKFTSGTAAVAASKSPKIIGKARENLALAFDLMGGVPGLVRWGKANPTEFYRIWARLIPKEAVEDSIAQPLETLLEQLAEKSALSVADAAREIGEETLARAAKTVNLEDAIAAHKHGETIQ